MSTLTPAKERAFLRMGRGHRWLLNNEVSSQTPSLQTDQKVRRAIIVSLDDVPRKLSGGIEVWPWHLFCQKLWAGDWV